LARTDLIGGPNSLARNLDMLVLQVRVRLLAGGHVCLGGASAAYACVDWLGAIV